MGEFSCFADQPWRRSPHSIEVSAALHCASESGATAMHVTARGRGAHLKQRTPSHLGSLSTRSALLRFALGSAPLCIAPVLCVLSSPLLSSPMYSNPPSNSDFGDNGGDMQMMPEGVPDEMAAMAAAGGRKKGAAQNNSLTPVTISALINAQHDQLTKQFVHGTKPLQHVRHNTQAASERGSEPRTVAR